MWALESLYDALPRSAMAGNVHGLEERVPDLGFAIAEWRHALNSAPASQRANLELRRHWMRAWKPVRSVASGSYPARGGFSRSKASVLGFVVLLLAPSVVMRTPPGNSMVRLACGRPRDGCRNAGMKKRT